MSRGHGDPGAGTRLWKRAAWALLGLAGLGGLLLLVRFGAERDLAAPAHIVPVQAPPVAPAEVPAPTIEVARSPTHIESRSHAAREAVQGAGSAALEVLVLAPDGSPLEGARVGFGHRSSEAWPYGMTEPTGVVTDGEGRATLPLNLAQGGELEAVVVLRPPYAPARAQVRLDERSVVVRLEAGLSAILELVDAYGRRVEAPVRVELAGPPTPAATRTSALSRVHARGERGEVEVLGLPRGASQLVLRAEGFAARAVTVVPGSPPTRRRVELAPEADLELLVLDASGVALPGARVEAIRLLGEGNSRAGALVRLDTGVTNELGLLRLGGTQADGGLSLFVEADHHRPLRSGVRLGELEDRRVTLQLEAGGTLELVVLDAAERPIPAVLALVDLSRHRLDVRLGGGMLAMQRADASGSARFEGLPVGVPIGVRVQARASDSAQILVRQELAPLAHGEVRRVPLRFDDAVRVTGTLRVGGRSRAGSVSFRPLAEGAGAHASSLDVAGDGRFEAWLPRGPYRVSATSGGSRLGQDVELFDALQLDLDLVGGRSIEGTLVDVEGRPLPDRTLLACMGSHVRARALSELDGSFVLENATQELLDVCVVTEAGLAFALVRGSRDADLGELVLEEVQLAGRVLDLETGEPLAAALRFKSPVARAVGGASSPLTPGASSPVTSGADGRFAVRLPPGSWELKPLLLQGQSVSTRILLAPKAASREVFVAASPLASHLWRRPPEARAEGEVEASAEGRGGRWSASFPVKHGTAAALLLPRGRVHLEFRGAHGERWIETVDVEAPE